MTTSISATNGAYTAAAGQAREATEKSVQTFKQEVEKFSEQVNVVAKLPTVDLTQSVTQYFEYVQKSVDFNRDLATKWAELFTSFSGTVREQATVVSDLAVKQAAEAEDIASEQASLAEEAKKEQEKAVRAAAKQAKQDSREPYEGLTKAELADILAERDLPKSGTVEELIERLVSADSE